MPRSSTRSWPASTSFKKGDALVPTWVAFAVVQLLEAHLPNLVDYRFTAQMEDDLDAISRGESGPHRLSAELLLRQRQAGLKKQLENKVDEIDARDVSRILIGQPEGEDPICVRVGRYGPFLEQGERRASIPDDSARRADASSRAGIARPGRRRPTSRWGIAPETGKPVYLKIGRFGPYVQRGNPRMKRSPRTLRCSRE